MELRSVSASQVDSFDRCVRYWYNRSILKIPSPQSAPQKKGQDIHAAVENYLRRGTIDLEWAGNVQIARKYLPEPKSKDVLIEQKIELVTYPGGPIWIGYIDLIHISKLPVKISDHKTIGNFNYMKTKKDLMVNTQMMSYAKWALEQVNLVEYLKTNPGPLTFDPSDFDNVDLEHIYIGTKEDRSETVSVRVHKNQVDSIWQRDVEKVKQMAEVAK